MSHTSAPLGFSGQQVDVPSHICLFYYDDVELRQRLPFLRIGLETEGEVAVLFGPRRRLQQILEYLEEDLGRNTEQDLADGKIVLIDGAPGVDQIMGNITETFDAIVARGVRLIRFLGFIGWQDPDWPLHDDLLAFESQVNHAVSMYPVVTVCTYRLTDIPGPVLIYAGINTHPLTIIGDTVAENPHYVQAAPNADTTRSEAPWQLPNRASFKGVRVSRRTDAS